MVKLLTPLSFALASYQAPAPEVAGRHPGEDGHDATVADNGQAAIDAFLAAQMRGEPDAQVITDLGMPCVDGRGVAAALRAASPSTPIVSRTGWGQRLLAEDDVPPHVSVLSKPPKLRELRSALAELTGDATPAGPPGPEHRAGQ